MANSRYYSSIAQQTTLTAGITPSATTILVASTSGFPGSVPYTLALDYGSATEELVEVTAVASLTLTVTRAIDGTAGASHNPGAVVRHVSSARDFTDSRTHEASSTGVHGVSGAVVGTSDSQSLSNKTLVRALGSMQNATFYNVGAVGITTIVGDNANPNASRLEIKDNDVALNTMIFVQSTGNIKSVKNASDTDSTYKVRLTDNDGTTDRFAVLAGGSLTITPTSTTTFVPLDIVAADTSTTKRSVRVAASGGGTERFTVFNDGRVAISGTATGQTHLKVTAPASQSVDIFAVVDSTAATLTSVQSTGKFLANRGAIVAQPGTLTGAVLQVGGPNVGYVGNLEQWVGPANSIVAQLDQAGNISLNEVNSVATTWTPFTPVWSGLGTGAHSINVGWYKKMGKIVFFEVYSVWNANGSGSTGVAVQFPTTPFRDGNGANSTRQAINGFIHLSNGSVIDGVCTMPAFAGDSGLTGATIRRYDGTQTQGSNYVIGTIATIQGWYREA